MKQLLFLTAIYVFLATACQNEQSVHSDDPATAEETSLPEMSVYHLPGTWTNQDGQEFELKELKGKVLVMVMIYTTCKAACPRLIADMRRIEELVPEKYGDDVQYIMVSIDPETDTPERLKSFAAENDMTDKRWMFIRSTPEYTREFATVLAVNYKRISPMDFSHSNIISVFDPQGEMVYQQEGLDAKHEKTIKNIVEQAKKIGNR
ncbi:SCO family protein [Membranicola marinus]|uniref:SCO family protein n=1 Tax=Membranihabitans marinus TaxID=1227546 RepID=A0A953L6N7_9BACT|nr:SCO family protein [Membranihabitans marinus]MBY5957852.1 SCO family protein [Membranihabitans marinus]